MNRNRTPNSREIMNRLSKIDSDTPTTAEWLRNYLKKGQFQVPEDKRTVFDIKIWLADQLQSPRGAYLESVDSIIDKIVRYWRVNKSRIGLVPVSVHLPPEVAEKLTKMAKGSTKQSVITQLIEGNYLALARENNEHKVKTQEAQNRFKIEKEKLRLNAYFEQQLAAKKPVKFVVPDEFKASVSQLYHILFPEKCSEFGQESELPDEPKKTD